MNFKEQQSDSNCWYETCQLQSCCLGTLCIKNLNVISPRVLTWFCKIPSILMTKHLLLIAKAVSTSMKVILS